MSNVELERGNINDLILCMILYKLDVSFFRKRKFFNYFKI